MLHEIQAPDAPAIVPDHAARLPAIVDVDPRGRMRLREVRAACIGVGAVGMAAALHLARLGVAELSIVDPGRVKPESLLTHPVGPEHVGEPKALVAARRAKALSPGTRVRAYDGPFEDLDTAELADADVVLLGTDNLRAEVEVGQSCLFLGIPLVQMSVAGEVLVAQVRSFQNGDGEGPCPACAYGSREWDELDRATRFPCDGSGATTDAPPTMSLSALCSLAADLAVLQVVRRVLGIEDPKPDAMLEYCAFTNRLVATRLDRDPDCVCEHRRWTRGVAPRPLAACTVLELLEAGGVAGPLPELSVTVEDMQWVESGVCGCFGHRSVRRFVPVGNTEAGFCPACDCALQPHPFSHHEVPAALLSSDLGRPLAELGVASPKSVLVRRNGRAVLFRGEAA